MPAIDETYLRRMESILELYERPLDPLEPVVCLDEKPVVLHGNARPVLHQPDGSVRRDYEYRRLGTANVFCSVQPRAGRHYLKVTDNRTKLAFAEMMRDIADAYPEAEKIHLVLDNLNTHTVGALIRRFGEDEGFRIWDRFCIHQTPTHASWLNQAEIQISMLARECFGKRRLASKEILAAEVKAWESDANMKKRRINWTFTRRDARRKFRYRVSTTNERSGY